MITLSLRCLQYFPVSPFELTSEIKMTCYHEEIPKKFISTGRQLQEKQMVNASCLAEVKMAKGVDKCCEHF